MPHQVALDHENLFCLPAGAATPPYPAELLGSERMQFLMREWRCVRPMTSSCWIVLRCSQSPILNTLKLWLTRPFSWRGPERPQRSRVAAFVPAPLAARRKTGKIRGIGVVLNFKSRCVLPHTMDTTVILPIPKHEYKKVAVSE